MLNFNIPEKLFILSIDDEQGAITTSVKNTLYYGLAGAALAELALVGKFELQDNRLTVIDPTPVGNNWLDEILATITAERKPRKLSRWVDTIGGKQTIKRMAEQLAEQNVIRIEKKRYLWVIPYEVYPQVDASAKYWVKHQLRAIVLTGEKAETPDIALLSLLKATRLLRLVFTRDERKHAEKHLDVLIQGEVFGEAVAHLLEDIESAALSTMTT